MHVHSFVCVVFFFNFLPFIMDPKCKYNMQILTCGKDKALLYLSLNVYLDSMPSGVTLSDPISMARAIPGASLSITSLVACSTKPKC